MACLVMMGSALNAQTTTFKYTATEKIDRFEEIHYFVGATAVQSHEFNEETGEGTVVYEGMVTELGNNCLQWQRVLTGIVIPEGVTRGISGTVLVIIFRPNNLAV